MASLSRPQREFVEYDDDFVLLVGGRRSGKTTACLRAAHELARDGKRVQFVRPRSPMKKLVHRLTGRGIETGGHPAMGHSMKPPRADYASGGSVVFLSGSNSTQLRGVHPTSDAPVVADGVSFLPDDYIDVLADAVAYNGSVYAATTPPEPEMHAVTQLGNAGYETVIAPTLSNPAVNPRHAKEISRSSHMFDTQFLIDPAQVGDHMLEKVSNSDGRKISCLLCDFEMSIPGTDVPGVATATEYVYGAALAERCL